MTLEKEFSFSFSGMTFSLKGEEPAVTAYSLLKKMLDRISKAGKKVLITIDEADSFEQMRLFAQGYQLLICQKYPLMLLMTGLYDNIYRFQEDKSLTFLHSSWLCPKV